MNPILLPSGRAMRRAMALAALFGLAGCAVGPNYRPPAAPAVDRYTASALPAATVSALAAGGDAQRFVEGTAVPQRWWTAFGNAELDRRVAQAFARSPSIAAAQAALRQASESARAARGGWLPTLDAHARVTRQNEAAVQSGAGVTTAPFTLYNAGVSVGYVFDVFGGVRRGIEVQSAAVDAQRAQLDATYLALAANVVTASVQEASLREQVAVTQEIVASLRQELDIAARQQAIGAKSLADTLAVRAQLAATEATLPGLQQRLAATATQLATYLGATPAGLQVQAVTLDAMRLPTDVPVSLPSTLVAQRPDIRAAAAELHGATAAVGVATADMLPQVTLAGSAGSTALRAGDLFAAGSNAWSVGLNVLQPLFHGGQLLHQKRAAEAGMDRALANWQQAVLVAFQNVADSLQALDFDARSLRAQAAAADDAERLLAMTRDQYRIGAVDYLHLLAAERQYQQARIAAIAARAARLADTAALYAALGGGWEAPGPGADAASGAAPAAGSPAAAASGRGRSSIRVSP